MQDAPAPTYPETRQGPPPFTFDHGAVSVPDIEAAIDWYGEVLGFAVARRFTLPNAHAQAAMLIRGDLRMEIFQPEDPVPLPPERREPDTDVRLLGNKHVAFRTDDMKGLLAWLTLQGADVALHVTNDFGSAVFVRDFAGNLIEFVERTPTKGSRSDC